MNVRRAAPCRRWRTARVVGWACAALLALLAIMRVLLAPDPSAAEGTRVALAQLTHLRPDLEGRANRMQELFPEGRVFTLALYGLAWVDVGRGTSDPALRARALSEARW
ncbi:MAG TPA: hypothetical protein VF665_03675, partial [Longimicrobium sp.]